MGRKENELAALIQGCETFTPRKLSKLYPELGAWDESTIALAVAELETLGAVSPIGEKRVHFAVNHERLDELLAAAEEAASDSDQNSPEAPAAPADVQANQEQGAEPKPKLVNKLPTKKSALDEVLARIQKIPKAPSYEGEALENKLNEVMEKLIGIVDHANEGVIALAERAPDVINADTAQIALKRVMPEKGGCGGVVAEYSCDDGHSKKVLFQRVWAKAPTDAWFRHLEKDLESECVHMLGRMAKYVEKHNKQR